MHAHCRRCARCNCLALCVSNMGISVSYSFLQHAVNPNIAIVHRTQTQSTNVQTRRAGMHCLALIYLLIAPWRIACGQDDGRFHLHTCSALHHRRPHRRCTPRSTTKVCVCITAAASAAHLHPPKNPTHTVALPRPSPTPPPRRSTSTATAMHSRKCSRVWKSSPPWWV